MNKLEQLKALIKESDSASSYIAQCEAACDLRACVAKLLLPLIAVAEAAKKIDWCNACLKNYEERHLVNVLQDALLLLTEDADK